MTVPAQRFAPAEPELFERQSGVCDDQLLTGRIGIRDRRWRPTRLA